jgi:hypothetical protein
MKKALYIFLGIFGILGFILFLTISYPSRPYVPPELLEDPPLKADPLGGTLLQENPKPEEEKKEGDPSQVSETPEETEESAEEMEYFPQLMVQTQNVESSRLKAFQSDLKENFNYEMKIQKSGDLSPYHLKRGEVLVDLEEGRLDIPGEICVQGGLIELFACTERGKTHESVMILFALPYLIHYGLEILGLSESSRGDFPGDPDAQTGSLLNITARWKKKGEKEVEYPIYQLILNEKTQSPLEELYWVFNGSLFRYQPMIQKEIYMADATGTIITTWSDPHTVIDSTHPLKMDDTVFFANHHLLPPRGTSILLTIRSAPATAKASFPQRVIPEESQEMRVESPEKEGEGTESEDR